MQRIYRRECWTTLIAFVVVTFLTHIFPVYFIFPGLVEFNIFGFPAHYLMTLVVGWLVLMPLYWYYIQVSEQIDEEIVQYQALDEAEGARPATPAGAQAPTGPQGGARATGGAQ